MKILSFGSLNIDYVYDVPHFVRAGETLNSTGKHVFCGGKGLNQSIAMHRAGAEVWHAGAVGKEDGQLLLEMLKREGIHTDLILTKETSSGHAIIQKDEKGQNSILLYGGANQEISKQDIEDILTYFEKGDYLVLQNEISEVGYLIEKAYQKGMIIILNPSPLTKELLDYPLEHVSWLILNEIEAKDLCLLNEEVSAELLMQELRVRFKDAHIVLTLGEKGAIFYGDQEQIFQPSHSVKVVDTTGAGDTFTGFLIASLIKNKSPQEAMAYAAMAAAVAVTRRGAAVAIPTLAEVEEKIIDN